MLPLATYWALRVKSVFVSKIICHLIHLYPIGAFASGPKKYWATLTFLHSFCIAAYQKVVFVALSIAKASSGLFGGCIPNFCARLAYGDWTWATIHFFLHSWFQTWNAMKKFHLTIQHKFSTLLCFLCVMDSNLILDLLEKDEPLVLIHLYCIILSD